MKIYVYFLFLLACFSTSSYAEHWMTDQATGCMVYTFSDDKSLQLTFFKGNCDSKKLVNGAIEFSGTDYRNYVGNSQSGKLSGKGIMTWFSGDRYEGNFKDGKFDGKGIMTWYNEDRYEGDFKDGKKNGRGIFTFKDRTQLSGNYVDDKREGQHTYVENGKASEIWTYKNDEKINTVSIELFNILKSNNAQTMYITAGKYAVSGSSDDAGKVYNAIINRFPDSQWAAKSIDQLTAIKRNESVVDAQRDAERASREASRNAAEALHNADRNASNRAACFSSVRRCEANCSDSSYYGSCIQNCQRTCN